MKYTVVWTQHAEQRLANLWLSDPAPQQITNAADDIDRHLTTDPLRFSHVSPKGFRQIIVPPLGVDFFVSDQDCKVIIATVWLQQGNTQ